MTQTQELNGATSTKLAEPTAAVAGAGYSELADSFAAGAEAAKEAISHAAAGNGLTPDLVLVFGTDKHDPTVLLQGVRSVIDPGVPLVGGYTVGAFNNDKLGYLGYEVGVAVISAPGMRVDVFTEQGLDERGEYEVGAALATRITKTHFDDAPNIVLFYDSVKTPQKSLNMATTILQGMSDVLHEWPAVAGVGVFGNLQFQHSHTWAGDQVFEQSATALVVSGGIQMDTIIMHGCRPSGRYHTITKAEGPTVLEIDGKPALDFFAEVMPDKEWEEYPLFLTLGVNNGDKFGPFREDDYANHLTMSVDKERGGIVMFEPNLTTGSEVQLMRRSIDFDYIDHRIDELFSRLDPARQPFFALYIDCAGRASAFCATEGEEAEVVQKALTKRGIPLLGMYSGVEIAKFGQEVQALDWTGVLCIFSR